MDAFHHKVSIIPGEIVKDHRDEPCVLILKVTKRMSGPSVNSSEVAVVVHPFLSIKGLTTDVTQEGSLKLFLVVE